MRREARGPSCAHSTSTPRPSRTVRRPCARPSAHEGLKEMSVPQQHGDVASDFARLILLQAGRFAWASIALNPAQSRNQHLAIPSIVNGALTLELLFKCIYSISTGKKPSRTHDYSAIF